MSCDRPPEAEPNLAASVADEQRAGQAVERLIETSTGQQGADEVLADVLRRMAEDHRYYAQRIQEIPPRSDGAPVEPLSSAPPPDPSRERRVPDLFGKPQQ